jgi:hypothetical protein
VRPARAPPSPTVGAGSFDLDFSASFVRAACDTGNDRFFLTGGFSEVVRRSAGARIYPRWSTVLEMQGR